MTVCMYISIYGFVCMYVHQHTLYVYDCMYVCTVYDCMNVCTSVYICMAFRTYMCGGSRIYCHFMYACKYDILNANLNTHG
jgi:hypothetical protein